MKFAGTDVPVASPLKQTPKALDDLIFPFSQKGVPQNQVFFFLGAGKARQGSKCVSFFVAKQNQR
jgi:hypothetical protein